MPVATKSAAVPVVVGVLLIMSVVSAGAQVPCVRHEMAFSCADGTRIAIVDDPSRMRGFRGQPRGGDGDFGSDPGRAEWWKDDQYIHGPGGQTCLLHGTHVHCGGFRED